MNFCSFFSKKNRVCCLFAITGLILIACERNKDPYLPELNYDADFSIYFLADDKLKVNDVLGKDINSLKLAFTPWLTDEDLHYYDWSSHCMYLKKEIDNFIPGWKTDGSLNWFPVEWTNKPFIVTANGKRCYMGYFYKVLSESWALPEIFEVYCWTYPPDVFYIDWSWLYLDYPQNHPEVKKALINTGIYHGGINVTLDVNDENTLHIIENADTSTISYKFTLKNNDTDDLYVLDPDKTGSIIFHYFTNGLVFMDIESKKVYEARWRESPELPFSSYLSPDWFTKLESGMSITREIVLKGYPYFPPGEYLFEFLYSGPLIGMTKKVRECADGRYWLGPTRSNILTMNCQENPKMQKMIKIESPVITPSMVNEYRQATQQ